MRYNQIIVKPFSFSLYTSHIRIRASRRECVISTNLHLLEFYVYLMLWCYVCLYVDAMRCALLFVLNGKTRAFFVFTNDIHIQDTNEKRRSTPNKTTPRCFYDAQSRHRFYVCICMLFFYATCLCYIPVQHNTREHNRVFQKFVLHCLVTVQLESKLRAT